MSFSKTQWEPDCILHTLLIKKKKTTLFFSLDAGAQVTVISVGHDCGWTSLMILELNSYQLVWLDSGLVLGLEQHSYQTIIPFLVYWLLIRFSTVRPVRPRANSMLGGANSLGPWAMRLKSRCVSTVRPVASQHYPKTRL